jgi:hypothetical protein
MHRFAVAAMAVLALLGLRPDMSALGARAKPSADSPASRTPETPAAPGPQGAHRVVHALDFSDYRDTSVEAWLHAKGLKFEEAAKNRDSLGLAVRDGALLLEAKEALRGVIMQESLEVKTFSKIRIEWGVLKYPEGASYEKRVRNEALMVLVFFGIEKIASGHLIYPDLPYFIGLYLCQEDQLNVPYTGKYYHEGGRFVCVGRPQPGEMITSEFDLVQAFRSYFEKSDVPPISGLALEVDTTASGDGGTAAAFIKRIEILD